MKSNDLLKNKRVLITAGPTREYLDPVRYISNDSSGKMGYALAKISKAAGAKVTLISGPTTLPRPTGVRFISTVTAEEMLKAAIAEFKNCDIAILAAAVADFRPVRTSRKKIKKTEAEPTLRLTKNPDILKTLGKGKKKDQMLVGFALETENIIKNALQKLRKKKCDLIVANDPANIGSDEAHAYIVTKESKPYKIKRKNKTNTAKEIIRFISEFKR